jgi:putative transposase
MINGAQKRFPAGRLRALRVRGHPLFCSFQQSVWSALSTARRSYRLVYEGILLFIWGLRTGSKRFRGWVKAGIWQKLFDAISGQPDMQYAMADATIVKVHRHGQGTELKAKP